MNRSRGARRESASFTQGTRPRPTTPGAQRVPLNTVDHNCNDFQDSYSSLSKSTKLPRKSQAKIARLSKSGPRRVARNAKSVAVSTQSERKHASKKQDRELENELLGNYTGVEEEYDSSSSTTDTEGENKNQQEIGGSTKPQGQGTQETVAAVVSNLVETAAQTAASETDLVMETQIHSSTNKRKGDSLTPFCYSSKKQRSGENTEVECSGESNECCPHAPHSSPSTNWINETPVKSLAPESYGGNEYSPSSTKWFETTEALVNARQDNDHLQQQRESLNAEVEIQKNKVQEYQSLYEAEKERRQMEGEDVRALLARVKATADDQLQNAEAQHSKTCNILENKVSTLEQERDKLRQSLEEYNEEDRANLRKQLCEVTRERDSLQIKNQEQQRQLNSLSSQLETQTEEKETIRKESENARQEAEQLANELQSQLEEVENDLEKAHKQIDEKELTIEKQQQDLSRLSTDKTNEENKRAELESKIHEQSKEIEELKVKQVNFEDENMGRLRQMEEKLQTIQNKKNDLEKNVERNKQLIEDYESSYQRLQEEHSNVKSQLVQSESSKTEIEQANAKLQQKHSHEKKSIEESYEQVVNQCREKCSTLKARVKKLEHQNENSVKQMRTVLQITQHVRSKLQAKLPEDQLKKAKGYIDKLDRLSTLLEQHIAKSENA